MGNSLLSGDCQQQKKEERKETATEESSTENLTSDWSGRDGSKRQLREKKSGKSPFPLDTKEGIRRAHSILVCGCVSDLGRVFPAPGQAPQEMETQGP